MSGKQTAIKHIVGLFGGQTALARAIGASQPSVWDWVKADRVPSARIPEIIAAAARLEPPLKLQPNDFFSVARATERENA